MVCECMCLSEGESECERDNDAVSLDHPGVDRANSLSCRVAAVCTRLALQSQGVYIFLFLLFTSVGNQSEGEEFPEPSLPQTQPFVPVCLKDPRRVVEKILYIDLSKAIKPS